jgi:gamma-glutamyl-gamma-aminobutyraldehyde dehydrogenase/4-guanidinobutyraldehyde dehydrogenase/NAD-dependent aldehyde dehydrogenase
VIAEVARGSAEDVDRAVRAARRVFEDGAWASCDPVERKRVLHRLADLIDKHLEELAGLESADVGHPIGDARAVDVPGARDCFAWYAEAIDKVYGEIAPTGTDALALIGREPLGVVGAVVPWNYPLIITAWKLAPALAAGNSVVLKPAEQSPLSALALAELANEAGVPAGVLNVVPGFGEEAGEPLGRHPGVDKIGFTGSVEIGRRFLRYAGESNGKAVSLELGGKSPHVVLADAADLDAAVQSIGWGIFYNAGQTCHAGSRVVVERGLADALTEKLVQFARDLEPADPALPETKLGALVSGEHLIGVLARVEQAASNGVRILVGGSRAEPVPGGAYMNPTVIDAPDPSDPIVQEEVFGPVLALQRAEDVEDAIRLANGTGYGLAAAVWTSNVTTAHRVARRLRAGTVWVNTFDVSSLTTPFGGVKNSGHGRDRSLRAVDSYTHLKTTWIAL